MIDVESKRSEALAPFAHSTFRWMWIAALFSNIGTLAQNVGATWLITEIGHSPFIVAATTSATTLPIFFLAIPAGALADVVDRRRLLLAAQCWMLLCALWLAVGVWWGQTSALFVIALTFALGLGFAMNAPAWLVTISELVPPAETAAAITLNSVSINISRAVGPALGGLLVGSLGPEAAFLFNAVSFLAVIAVLYVWKNPHRESPFPAERVWGAMRAGVAYARHSRDVQRVLARAALFVLGASGLWALLPVLTNETLRGNATTYGFLLGAMGAGAVAAAMLTAQARKRLGPDRTLIVGTCGFGLVAILLPWVPSFPLWFLLLAIAGICWTADLSVCNAAIQLNSADWVKARTTSIYLLIFYGVTALAGLVWGRIADDIGAERALQVSGLVTLLGALPALWISLPNAAREQLAAWPHQPHPTENPSESTESVLVTVEYHIDIQKSREFVVTMQRLKQVRLRNGALQWYLFQDSEVAGRFLEVFLIDTWLNHLRQHERTTVADHEISVAARSFHRDDSPPRVEHWMGSSLRTDSSS
jgi:MFS family permease